jgi:O-antigen ligase
LAHFYRFAVWPRNFLIAVLMLFLVVTITCLKGRSAYLALLLLSPWMFTVLFRRCRVIPVFAAVVLTVVLMVSSGTVRARLALIPKEIELFRSGTSLTYQLPDGTVTPSSIGLRIRMWKNAGRIFMGHPLLGAGTAGYKHETDILDPSLSLSHPHSSYLYVAASYGLLGIGLYGWLLYATLKRGWRSRHTLAGHSLLAFVLVILIGSLSDTQILTAATGVALGFAVGIPTPTVTQCES